MPEISGGFMELELVRVDFLDHSDCKSEVSGLIPCTVWGLLLKETKQSLHILKWCADSNAYDDNSETWCILKHQVIVIDRIRWENTENRVKEIS